MKIESDELKQINGGGIALGILGLIGVGVVFLIGVFDGYVRPLKCNS